jgi:hypothetical protein
VAALHEPEAELEHESHAAAAARLAADVVMDERDVHRRGGISCDQ